MRSAPGSRVLVLAAWLFSAPSLFAQYQTPIVDGTINVGEYANTNGFWSMTWDATYLYVAHADYDPTNDTMVVYADGNPLSTPGGGTASHGNLTGTADIGITPELPFRADVRAARHCGACGGVASLRTRDGAGSWTGDNTDMNDVTTATNGATIEMRIRWAAIPGLSGVPSSFAWLGYLIDNESATTVREPAPAANPTGTGSAPALPYFFAIASTADGAATNPFSVRQSTWRVLSNADSGADSLREAITSANTDADSARRFITFGLGGGQTTISPATNLPSITRTTTIDGTSQNGGTAPAVTLAGFGPPAVGISLNNASNCVIRGLVLQNHSVALSIFSGTGNVVAGNYIGTNAAGTAAAANETGISAQSTANLTIGGTSAADRNVISGNGDGIETLSATNVLVQGNYVGTDAAGSGAIPNLVGMGFTSSTGTVGATGAQNVISGNTNNGAEDDGGISYFNNRIGVAASIGTPLGNGGYGIGSTSNGLNKVVGSIALPNIIAYNSGAVEAENSGGLLIRGNQIFGNTASSITVSNVVQPAPAVNSAIVSANSLTINFSLTSNNVSAPTQSMQLDLYLADTTNAIAQPGSYFATSPCYSGSTLTNQDWVAASGQTAGRTYVLIATSYSDGSCVTPGDGSSANTAVFASTAPHVFTGPGVFSDTSKWSGNALPPASADFQIVGLCTFDDASPVRTYGDMTLGDATTAGTVSWPTTGNAVVLDVEDVAKAPAAPGALLDMTDAGTLRVSGNFSLVGGELTGGSGTVEFTGTGKTVSSGSAIFNNITITGSLTIGQTVYFKGTLDVQSGGSFSGSSSTFLRPQNGASITGSGTKSFGRVEVNNGMSVTASGNFSVGTVFTIDGTFTPTASTVISGTGTVNGVGTMVVTRNGSNAMGNQYAMTTIDTTTNTVEYAGTANQFINSRTYKNIILNNPVTVQLNGDMTVTGVVNFVQGLAMGSGSDFIITDSSTSAVVQGTGWTRLTFRRAVTTGTNTYLFPIGPGIGKMSVNVTLHDVTAAGTVRMLAVTQNSNQIAGGSGIDNSRDVGNVFQMAFENGVTLASYDLAITFNALYDAAADPNTFVFRRASGFGGTWTDLAATNTATSIATTGETVFTEHYYAIGNQSIHHYVVTAASPQSAGTPFTTTVTALDELNVTAKNSFTEVTMSSSTGNAQFDSDGNGTFGDNTKTLTNGSFTISTKDNVIESVTITATDANSKTGSVAIVVNLGPPSGATTTIDANPTTIAANGKTTSTITVQVRDVAGNNYTSSAGTLVLLTTLGTLDPVSDNNNGTYTATLRTGTTGGTATVSGTISATPISDTAVVTFTSVPFGTSGEFTATATGTTQVQLSWTGVEGGTLYEVYRSSLNSPYALVVSTSGLDAFDNAVSPGTTYLYKVRVVGTGGTTAFGPVDPATTIVFTDTNVSGAAIKALHITELRTAVNAMRAAAGLSPATFTDASLTSGNSIKAPHVTELRTAVDAARNAIGLAVPLYTDPTVTPSVTASKAVHITELRGRVQ